MPEIGLLRTLSAPIMTPLLVPGGEVKILADLCALVGRKESVHPRPSLVGPTEHHAPSSCRCVVDRWIGQLDRRWSQICIEDTL